MIRLTVNGEKRQFDGDPEMPLLWYLREELQYTGTKYGCGQGLCGACTIHLNGKAVRSCQTPVRGAANQSITTIEGLSATATHPLQEAWREHRVPQCGYCQSGQLMQAAALLSEKPSPSDEEIESAMRGNICRCGTYQRIRAAVKDASAKMATQPRPSAKGAR